MAFRPAILTGALAGLALMLAAAPAGAAWLAAGTGSTASSGLAMPAGNVPSPSVAAGSADVVLSWGASTLDVASLGYRIQRFPAAGGAGIMPGAGCAGTLVALSCTESSVPAGQWRYAVTPVLANWSGAMSARSASVTAAPPAPTALTATPNPPITIGLSWSPAAGATSYTIYRSLSVTGPFTTSVGTTTNTSFTDTPPVGGSAYSYAVTAVAGGMESAPSNVATATAPTPPGGRSGPVVNPGFESGALAPWVSSPAAGGSSAAVTTFAAKGVAYAPVSGVYFAVVTPGAKSIYSHLSQTIQVAAGDSVTGSAFFLSGDYMPFNDDGAVVIEHNGIDVATVFASSVSVIGQNKGTPWTSWSYTFPSAGTYTIDARVRNIGDATNPSYVGIDNLSYTSLNVPGAAAPPRSGFLAQPPAGRRTTPLGAGTVVTNGPNSRVTVTIDPGTTATTAPRKPWASTGTQ